MFNTRGVTFPADKYDTLEYSWVKATSVSVFLRISLCVLINTNTHPLQNTLSSRMASHALALHTASCSTYNLDGVPTSIDLMPKSTFVREEAR
jgi:hypothetical protein